MAEEDQIPDTVTEAMTPLLKFCQWAVCRSGSKSTLACAVVKGVVSCAHHLQHLLCVGFPVGGGVEKATWPDYSL